MDRISELLRRHRIRIVWTQVLIARLIPVRAPMAFVFSCFGVVDDHSVVAVTICDVRFIFLFVDEDFGWASQILHVVAALALAGLADLHEKFSGLGELQDHGVVGITQRAAGLFFILFLTCAYGG